MEVVLTSTLLSVSVKKLLQLLKVSSTELVRNYFLLCFDLVAGSRKTDSRLGTRATFEARRSSSEALATFQSLGEETKTATLKLRETERCKDEQRKREMGEISH